ncbi:MAG: hypothetical protein INF81_08990 [Roseomonas sp.]|nr:hypothetical protein [Roseomonas sp.]MCA3430019.1 hypothetical protein [Roseomonas sp.]MCA3434507.1 hypothetical protein [Roseomonas sp.]
MAAKRKTKHPAKPREDLSAPSKWRMQHGDIGTATRVADTETGTPILQPKARDPQASAEGGLEIAHRGHQYQRIGR